MDSRIRTLIVVLLAIAQSAFAVDTVTLDSASKQVKNPVTRFGIGNDVLYSPLSHAHSFASLTGKPTTLSGYGITDGQLHDSDLDDIAALATTSFGRDFLTLADAAAARTKLSLGSSATHASSDYELAL